VNTVEVDFPAGRKLRVLEHRANAQKHGHASHERAYLEALLGSLSPHDVVFDVGAEEGEFGALVAQVVGPEHVHMFEPAPWYWPNIWSVWKANGFDRPGGAFPGFATDVSSGYWQSLLTGWPDEIMHPRRLEGGFVTLYERGREFPTVELDDYADHREMPTVLMIDVEGAEELVLRGAYRTLHEHRPRVFVSVHPDEWIAKYREFGTGEACSREALFGLMEHHGYRTQHISTDHEEHWLFT
jgi:FkbM family methyltransferase